MKLKEKVKQTKIELYKKSKKNERSCSRLYSERKGRKLSLMLEKRKREIEVFNFKV